jgi:hypothetical protein
MKLLLAVVRPASLAVLLATVAAPMSAAAVEDGRRATGDG